MTEHTENEAGPHPEPNFELTEAERSAELEALGAIAQRNRMRVLIPLGLLIVLWAILGLFGDPLDRLDTTPVDSAPSVRP